MKSFDTIAKMSAGALIAILTICGGQYILNNNQKDECLYGNKSLVYSDSFIGDIFTCKDF